MASSVALRLRLLLSFVVRCSFVCLPAAVSIERRFHARSTSPNSNTLRSHSHPHNRLTQSFKPEIEVLSTMESTRYLTTGIDVGMLFVVVRSALCAFVVVAASCAFAGCDCSCDVLCVFCVDPTHVTMWCHRSHVSVALPVPPLPCHHHATSFVQMCKS